MAVAAVDGPVLSPSVAELAVTVTTTLVESAGVTPRL